MVPIETGSLWPVSFRMHLNTERFTGRQVSFCKPGYLVGQLESSGSGKTK